MKKLYVQATRAESPEGFAIILDNKPAKTPGGNALLLPFDTLAQAIVAEWQSQGETVRKETMKLTQLACIAIDLAEPQRDMVMEELLPYGETDLVCYREGDVAALKSQQAELLDPLISWAQARFDVRLQTTDGLMPVPQPAGTREKWVVALQAYDRWQLAALSGVVKPLSSLVLGLALVEGHIDAEQAFQLSQLEETYETDRWGRDEEKEIRRAHLHENILAAGQFLQLLHRPHATGTHPLVKQKPD